jgi:hypothetical protein
MAGDVANVLLLAGIVALLVFNAWRDKHTK